MVGRLQLACDASLALRNRLRHVDPLQARFYRPLCAQPAWSVGENGDRLRWGGMPDDINATGLRCDTPSGIVWIGLHNWQPLKDVLVVDRRDVPDTFGWA